MANISREKLKIILLEQTSSDLLKILFASLGNNKDLLVGEILDMGDYELTQALRSCMNWDFHVKG